jgi:hypothetical protein
MVTLNTMFKLGVNKACNTSCLDRPIIAGMHIQMERLYRAAKELKNIGNQAELARALNQSSQTVNRMLTASSLPARRMQWMELSAFELAAGRKPFLCGR